MTAHVILYAEKDGWIVAEVPELPGCVSEGKTEVEARSNIQDAIAAWLWVESLRGAGRPKLDSAGKPHHT
jgi:predicted RNase H-like HicB family nuclease